MIKKIIKDTLALVVIAFVAVLCLALVYALTKGPIAEAEQNEKINAYLEVCEAADSFDLDNIAPDKEYLPDVSVDEVHIAKSADGTTVGAVMLLTTNQGYGGNITISMSVTADGTLGAIKVISMSETPGLGAKCTDSAWTEQFGGINAEKVVYTKDGKTADNEIDAITGATYTTEAIVGAVNVGLECFRDLVSGGVIK